MPHKTIYIERDSRGNERLVRTTRSHSHGRKSDRELLNESEEREATLGDEIAALQTRLSYAQRDQWQLERLREEHQRLVHAHGGCRNTHAQLDAQLNAQIREVRRLEDLLADEEDKVDKLQRKVEELKERIRLMKRTSGEYEVYRSKYEEKSLENEVLRQRLIDREEKVIEQAEQIILAETRIADRNRTIAEKNSTIQYLKNYLRTHGFRVDG